MGSFLRHIHLILTLTCDRATQLTSDSMERELLWHEHWALVVHKISCWSCRQFARQLGFLRTAMQRFQRTEQQSLDAGEALDPAFKQRLKRLKI